MPRRSGGITGILSDSAVILAPATTAARSLGLRPRLNPGCKGLVQTGLCRFRLFPVYVFPNHRRPFTRPNACPETIWTKLLVAMDVKPSLVKRRSSYVAGTTEAGTTNGHDPDGKGLAGVLAQLT